MINRIKDLREAVGLTQAELAKSCGWDRAQSRVSNYEIGARKPSLGEVRIIVSALNKHGARNEQGMPCTIDDVFPPDPSVAA